MFYQNKKQDTTEIVHPFVIVSAYTLVAISVDRYMAILWPLKPRMSKRLAKFIILMVWTIALATAVPIAVVSELEQPSEWHTACQMVSTSSTPIGTFMGENSERYKIVVPRGSASVAIREGIFGVVSNLLLRVGSSWWWRRREIGIRRTSRLSCRARTNFGKVQPPGRKSRRMLGDRHLFPKLGAGYVGPPALEAIGASRWSKSPAHT
ncbi:hypothetical protein AAG570_003378 [Ranatra chinensis]|uniref:G-protein coupled receptors family 1 profile domain-containing protein n=1 Tax=Ranatra chinensis TaxID=642074 RepID=A0ABD0Y3H5_9HEMI